MPREQTKAQLSARIEELTRQCDVLNTRNNNLVYCLNDLQGLLKKEKAAHEETQRVLASVKAGNPHAGKPAGLGPL